MAFFNWFKGAHKAYAASPAGARAAVSSHARTGAASPGDSAARLKNERARLREMLYNVVRESMVRVGVLSSSFKFKVLATDPRGRKFIVMMDLARDFDSSISQLTEIETLICHAAKARHNITVSHVYWRCETAAIGARAAGAAPRTTTPSPVFPGAMGSKIGAGVPMPDAPAVPRDRSRPAFDPLLSEEVSALRRALSAGVGSPAAPSRAAAPDPVRLTGYENTEIIESRLPPPLEGEEMETADDEATYPALSPTQYGDLH